MLGEDFELEFVDGTLWIDADVRRGALGALLELVAARDRAPAKLDAERGEAFHQAFVELYETYREGDRIRAPRRYLLTLGTRR